MDRTENGFIYPGQGDLNRLVRDRIDFEGFKRWYDALSTPEQAALITILHQFAIQAGIDDATCTAAIVHGGLEPIRFNYHHRRGVSGTGSRIWKI